MDDKKVKIIRNETSIKIEKLCYTHVMSTELSYNTIANFYFHDKKGYIHQYTFEPAKEYKTFTGWKKAVKRLFDIDIKEEVKEGAL